MDLESGLIGAIISAICIFPFVVMYYNRVKKENKMLQSLRACALPYGCNISQHEFCGDFVIGLDDRKGFAFLLKQKKEESVSQFVDLSATQVCKIAKQIRTGNGVLGVIERVELNFIPSTKGAGETRFELYDEDVNMILTGELQLAEKWAGQINELLKKK